MANTLKIAVILVGLFCIAAAGAVVYLAIQPDKDVQKFLNTPGQIEKFITAAKNQQKKEQSPQSPLVEQAKLFTNRIDPPPPPQPRFPTTPTQPRPSQNVVRTPPPSAKFTVEGTVVSANPENSRVFLNTTSKGLRWYGVNEKLGHYTIEEIHKDIVVVNDGTQVFEMEVPKRQKISLLKGDPDNPYTSENVNPYKSFKDSEQGFEPVGRGIPATTSPRSRRSGSTTGRTRIPPRQAPPTVVTEEMMKENIDFLQQLANDPESMGISKEEAQELGDMAELINQMESEMKNIKKRQPAGK